MSKHEAPPFRMVIERGKLVPATAYDAERLDTYRSGSTVRVRFVEERDRWGIRKWWAVVNRAVKECPTPWQTAAEASEAIKLALGIVNLTKTVGGEFMAYPKSLTELTDPELEDAVEQMLAVMTRVTGIDPDDWRKHIADIGKDEPSEPSDESARSTDAGTSDPSPVPVPVAGATLSADEADAPAQDAAGQVETGATAPETNAVETGHGGQPASVSTASEREMVNQPNKMNTDFLKAEMIRKVVEYSGNGKIDVADRLQELDLLRTDWIERIPGHPTLIDQVFKTAAKIVRGELKPDVARRFMENNL